MLMTSATTPTTCPGWVYEEKLDGWRTIVTVNDGLARLWSRNGNPFPQRFDCLNSLPDGTVLDGELVSIQDSRPSLRAVQQQRGPFSLVLFDVLRYGGEDLTPVELLYRRMVMDGLDLGNGVTRTEQHANGVELFERVRSEGGEGIIAKRSLGRYWCGDRSNTWQKVKVRGYKSR